MFTQVSCVYAPFLHLRFLYRVDKLDEMDNLGLRLDTFSPEIEDIPNVEFLAPAHDNGVELTDERRGEYLITN